MDRRNVELELEPVEFASSYEVRVARILREGKTKEPMLFKLARPEWRADIRPGRYLLQIRSYDERGVPGDWSEAVEFIVKLSPPNILAPTPGAKLTAKEADKEKVKFSWQEKSGAASYRLEVQTPEGQSLHLSEVKGLETEVELAVAKDYQWRVTSIMSEGELGDVREDWTKFTLLGPVLDTPKIALPLSKFVEELSWEKPEHAMEFTYILSRLDKDKWRNIERKTKFTENRIPFSLSRPSGRYRLRVRASAPMRADSPVATLTFEAKGGLRDPAAIETAKLIEGLEKPSPVYAIASYFATNMQYVGYLPDQNSQVEFEALGGTGRLGMGYHFPYSNWGVFGVVDLSGFTIDGRNFTFASAETQVTRKVQWGVNQILINGGMYMKELPAIAGNAVDGLTKVGKTASMGPSGGVQIWRPISQRLGAQLNAQVYYSMITLEAPSGGEVSPELSYRLGLLGSYKLTQKIMGFAGYAYRLDQVTYTVPPDDSIGAFNPTGTTNNVQIEGHYMNFVLEVSF